ncbi:hypothetical protein [Propionivibrio sp.]|uniref:hypothetical protein n=1 Tax=Propionivibrio sp. TaxID=2212460 RepID=UPI003BF1F6A3
MMEIESWLNRHRVRSTSIVSIAMWMLVDCQLWAKQFAMGNPRDGLEIAAIIVAVTGPATLLAGWAFKIMQESKHI